MLVACDGSSAEEDRGVSVGPLSVGTGSGGSGLYPPPGVQEWRGTFGGFVLCSKTDAVITLDRVRVTTLVDPEDLDIFVRTVEPTKAKVVDESAFIPLGTALGGAPAFDEPYVTGPVEGSFSRRVAGTVVDEPCGSNANAVNGFKELLFTMQVEESGGQISSAEIDYSADGQEHTLLVDWQMVACGKDVDDEICPG